MSNRYFTPVGTAATGDFVAVMAEAARIYQPYDADFAAKCLAAARLSYGFLQDEHRSGRFPSTPQFSTGGYGDSNDNDERMWAAAELWETTGESGFLTDFESRAAKPQNPIATSFDWQNVGNLGMFTYLLSKRDGRNPDLVSSLQSSLIDDCRGARQAGDRQQLRPPDRLLLGRERRRRAHGDEPGGRRTRSRPIRATRTRSSAGSITCSAATTTIGPRSR